MGAWTGGPGIRPGLNLMWTVIRHISLMLVTTLMLSACGEDNTGTPVTVQGTIQYEDKEYSASGFTGNTDFKPVRFAAVDLVDANGNVVGHTRSDEDGNYSVSGTSNYLYVRVLAQTDLQAGAPIQVKNYAGEIYAVKHAVVPQGNDPLQLDLSISLSVPASGAFNILDVFTNGARYISQLSSNSLPELTAVWQPFSSRYGTYYCAKVYLSSSCPQGRGVYLLGGYQSGGDTDEYDDDVLYHEFGHYLEASLGILDSPGGRHYITDNDSDIRLAWSEGFGGFIPGAVKSWLKQYDPQKLSTPQSLSSSYFVDTSGSYAAISLDMGNPSARYCSYGRDCFVYSTSEVSVAKVLNQIDTVFGSQAWWEAVAGYLVSGTNEAATLETFWDGWLLQRSPDAQELAQLQTILEDRKIYYGADAYELDTLSNTTASIDVCVSSPCTSLNRNLYGGVNEKDFVRFEAGMGNSYRVETFELSNGADTYIRILDQNYNLVYDNSGLAIQNNDRVGTVYCYPFDNPCRIHNDATMLSSSVVFTPSISGTYIIEIKTNPSRPSAAGRFGSYHLKVTENP